MISGASTLQVVEDAENLPRPEEDRITQAEKNKKMQEQLKVMGLSRVSSLCCFKH